MPSMSNDDEIWLPDAFCASAWHDLAEITRDIVGDRNRSTELDVRERARDDDARFSGEKLCFSRRGGQESDREP